MSNTTLAERLKLALEKSGKTQRALAQFCNTSTAAVNYWLSGKTKELAASNAIKAAIFLGVSTEWLTTGKGNMNDGSVSALHDEDDVPTGFIEIPEYRVECGCGDRATPTFEEVSDAKRAVYRVDWFVDHAVSAKNCRRLKVTGDSMAPILFDGDSILCDCAPQQIVSGKIYAFCFGDSVRVKRLYTKLNGGLTVHSENPQEKDEEISPEEMSQFYLIGRVIDRSGSGPF